MGKISNKRLRESIIYRRNINVNNLNYQGLPYTDSFIIFDHRSKSEGKICRQVRESSKSEHIGVGEPVPTIEKKRVFVRHA